MKKIVSFTAILLSLLMFSATGCNKTKRNTNLLGGESWTVTTLTVDGTAQAEIPTLSFSECDPYNEVCTGEWLHELGHHALFSWQFRNKGKTFEISNQSTLEDAHGAGHEAEENILQCQNFSGVYEVTERSKKKMQFRSTAVLGFPGQTVEMVLEKK